MALSKVDLANQVENQLPQNLVANNLPFRNIFINGDMSIAQRGTSFSSISSGNSNYPVDRFRLNISNGTAGTWTISQDATVPTGQGFPKSFKMDCTTANASLSAGSFIVIQQLVEAQNLQYLKFGTSSAESLTLSFWVRSNKTGTYICEIRQDDSNRAFSKSYTIDSADTWEKKTITYPGDTTGVINNDNGVGLELNFWLAAGSTYSSGSLQTSWGTRTNANMAPGQVNLADSTSNELYLTGVQLEAGTSASDFQFLPYDVNYLRCARYCWRPMYEYSAVKYLHSQGGYKDANYVAFHVVPPVPMRTTPSVTEIGNVDVWSQNGFYTGWTWGFIMGIHSGAEWYVSGNKASHGIADANMPYAVINTQADGWLQYNAEL